MNYKNLMIGDYIRIIPLDLVARIIALKEINSNIYIMTDQVQNFLLANEENFGPILLTEEILKKNFKSNGYDCYYIFTNNDIGECLYYNYEHCTLCYKPDKDSLCCCMQDNVIKYVHELQLFLKGIKYDRKIIL